MSYRLTIKSGHDELAKLCEGHKVRRDTRAKYHRHQLPSGKLGTKSTERVEAPVRYAKDAYRADKRKGGNSPNLWGLPSCPGGPSVNVPASRDYLKR